MLLGALYGGFWDYWELNHLVTFDGVNKVIIINDTTTNLSVKVDLYSDWKEWLKLEDNGKYEAALRTIGGDPTIDIQNAGDIYFMINGWRVAVDLTTARIEGTLFSDDFESAWIDKTQYIDNGLFVPVFPALASSLVTGIDSSQIATPESIRTELTPELTLIDTSVSSRASQTSVNNLQSDVTNIETKVDAVDLLVNNIDTNVTTIDGRVDAIQVDITNIIDVIDTIRKYHTNRSFINKNNHTLTIYEDNGTTPFKVFDLKDDNGVASVEKIFERLPQ